MTHEDYVGRGNALALELQRVRNILDSAATARERYRIEPPEQLMAQARHDWSHVIGRIRKLDEDYWGKLPAP